MKISFTLLVTLLFTASLSAQVFESTKVWFPQDHSAWKIEPQSVQGYVIAGSKFFEPANTDLYFSQFDEFGQFGWTRSHASGFTSLDVFWKSFCKSTSPVGFFSVASGTQGGQHKAYALLVNSFGMKWWDRVSNLPEGITFGGVCIATNGGYIACGGNGEGNAAICKFDAYGNLEWSKTYPVSAFLWSVKPAVGGGYVAAGTRQVVRIDHLGNFNGSSTLTLPVSPDGSAYSYTEFEEILPLPTNDGFIVTGSAFSNSHSAAYSARFTYAGSQVWSRVHDAQNTNLAGTPVAWINNAVVSGSNEIVTSWRRGPVSTGGTMFFQKMNFGGTLIGAIGSMGNNIPVQEAFMTKAHGKYVVGGVRGTYSAVYAYAREFLPATGAQTNEEENLPTIAGSALLGGRRQQISVINSQPEFEQGTAVEPGPWSPVSRVFYTDLSVYPNPTTGLVNIGGMLEPGAMLRVMDMTGRLVYERQIQEGERLINADLSNQAKGVYNVVVTGNNGVMTKKVVLN